MVCSGPVLRDGYAYELTGRRWRTADSEKWETVMVVPSETAGARFVGRVVIDGWWCDVFRCADGKFRAALVRG